MDSLRQILNNHGVYAPVSFGADADSFDFASDIPVGLLIYEDVEDSRVEEVQEIIDRNGLLHVWAMKDGTWEE